jgi:hypothetical protein
MRADDWRGALRALRGSGKINTFTYDVIKKYKEACPSRAARYQARLPKEMQIKIPTLMLWGHNPGTYKVLVRHIQNRVKFQKSRTSK